MTRCHNEGIKMGVAIKKLHPFFCFYFSKVCKPSMTLWGGIRKDVTWRNYT